MNIEDMRTIKRKLECELLELITSFEKQTKIHVTEVDLDSIDISGPSSGKRREVVSVSVAVELV